MQTSPLFGPYGSSALDSIAQFSELGANACWFHGFDPAAFDTCQKHAISACVEFKTFRADFGTHPGLIPIGVDGRPIRTGSSRERAKMRFAARNEGDRFWRFTEFGIHHSFLWF